MTPQACACKPGTEANGWHEHRCNDCMAEERRMFGAVFAFHAQRSAASVTVESEGTA